MLLMDLKCQITDLKRAGVRYCGCQSESCPFVTGYGYRIIYPRDSVSPTVIPAMPPITVRTNIPLPLPPHRVLVGTLGISVSAPIFPPVIK